jgi:hypothetical protein
MNVSSQQRFSKNFIKRKMISGILDFFSWLLLFLGIHANVLNVGTAKTKWRSSLDLIMIVLIDFYTTATCNLQHAIV